jgi:hypothetical protein
MASKKYVVFTLALIALAHVLANRPSKVSSSANTEQISPAPISRAAVAFATSAKMSSLPLVRPRSSGAPQIRTAGDVGNEVKTSNSQIVHDADGAIARTSLIEMPQPSLTFDGISNYDNITAYNAFIMPPDMIGDVGPNHYVQAVNALVRIFDKSGNALTPPFRMSQLFAPLNTTCSTLDSGLPVVLYDTLADRWLLSQYCYNRPPFRQMVAISKTGDPTGAYFVYEFVMPNIRINDFAKFGVWPDGYYMSTEEFTGSDFSGSGMFAFDRAKMLVGDPTASYIYFNRPSSTAARLGNLLPADLDGLRPPPVGAPNIFVGYSATEYGDAQDAIRLFDFHADFTTPANSTFTERSESPLPVAAFDPTSPEGRTDIAQPAPGEFLDANSDRINYRVAYRNFGASDSLIFNQTARISSTPYRAGVRFYELRRTGAAFSVIEQSTIGDVDSSRWIASVAADHQGNVAVGYNHVSDQKKPSILYTGKLASEPAGTFRQETFLMEGTGVQKAFGWRWGDYSGMSVDPIDDCTFWMTGEYYTLESQTHSDFTWLTRIGKFKFTECTAAPRANITGVVTNAMTGQPIENAKVATSAYMRVTDAIGSYGNLTVLPATYVVTASASGFAPQSFTLSPANGQTVTQNFALEPVAIPTSNGTAIAGESCATNGGADPGETISLSLSLRNTGQLAANNVVATLQATGGVTAPGPAQNYGLLPVGGAPITRNFTFTVAANVLCGAQVTMSFQITDGATSLGTLTIPLQTGVQKIAFKQNFDRTPSAQLPVRWTRESFDLQLVPDSTRHWRISNARVTSGTKSVFAPDPHPAGQSSMTTPVFLISTQSARLTFQNWYRLETTFLRNRLYDGSVLEIKIGNSAWQDILAAGGVFETGGYDGTIDACCQNPLAGRLGWSGRSGINDDPEFVPVSVRLPQPAAGQQVQLRWRLGTDIGNGIVIEGQYIDDIVVTDGFACGCSTSLR